MDATDRPDEWHDQERRLGTTTHIGEAGLGALIAIGLQVLLSAVLVGVGALSGAQGMSAAGWLSCAACSQFIWLFPAFVGALWWRPGFAGGLAAGALFGSFLGIALSCLAAFA